jgi:membrane protein
MTARGRDPLTCPADASQSPMPPQRPRTWWRTAVRVIDRIQTHNLGLLAGGVAMYCLLSIFPGLAAAVLLYGLFATPADIAHHMSVFAGVLPPGTWQIFKTELEDVAAHDHGTLSVAAALGLLIALWSARLTMSALMTAMNIAFEVVERRGFFRHMFVSVLLTLGAVVGFLGMLLVGIVIPIALLMLGSSFWIRLVVTVVRWGLLWVFAVVGLALLYHFAPAQRPKRWRWLSYGSVLTATCWLLVSGLFACYVRFLASYDRTYGALGSVVVLLVWFYLLAYIVILGAELDAEISTGAGSAGTQPSA